MWKSKKTYGTDGFNHGRISCRDIFTNIPDTSRRVGKGQKKKEGPKILLSTFNNQVDDWLRHSVMTIGSDSFVNVS